jgi:Tol biopolymer transport system component
VDGSGNVAAEARTLVWVDRAGKETPIPAPPRAYDHPRLSPDETRVVLYCRDQEQDLWIWDLVGHAGLTRLTLDPGQDWFPVWTTDSRRVIFISQRGGNGSLWWQAADGSGVAERLTTSDHGQFASGITPDRAVVFNEAMPNRQLLMVALDGTRQVTRLLETKYNERGGVVSPNGQWLARDSDRSTVFQIYVTPFPNVNDGGEWEVSTAGGTQPLWAPSGKELFYVGPDGALIEVPVETSGATFKHSTPIKLFEARYYTGSGGGSGRTYDVSSDGQRFLMIKAPRTDAGAAPPALIVVQHWDEELKRLVPTK